MLRLQCALSDLSKLLQRTKVQQRMSYMQSVVATQLTKCIIVLRCPTNKHVGAKMTNLYLSVASQYGVVSPLQHIGTIKSDVWTSVAETLSC